MQPRVAGVLLAAGEGSRLGRRRRWSRSVGGGWPTGGGAAAGRGAGPVVLVAGAAAVAVPGAVVVHNPAWATGLGSSLAAGLAAVRALPGQACGAAVIALADQPLVGPGSVRRLIAAHRAGARIAVAAYGGRPRNPVLIARAHWEEVLAMAAGTPAPARSCAPTLTCARWSSAGIPAAPTISTRPRTSRASRSFWPRKTGPDTAGPDRYRAKLPRGIECLPLIR